MKIFLKGLQFHAYHGVYKEEQLTGTAFEVNLEVIFEEQAYINQLHQTISYTELYLIVKERMKKPEKLLETIAMDLVMLIKQQFPQVKEINITLSKLKPPILNFQGETGISYHKKFE